MSFDSPDSHPFLDEADGCTGRSHSGSKGVAQVVEACFEKPAVAGFSLGRRGWDLNPRPPGYEPGEGDATGPPGDLGQLESGRCSSRYCPTGHGANVATWRRRPRASLTGSAWNARASPVRVNTSEHHPGAASRRGHRAEPRADRISASRQRSPLTDRGRFDGRAIIEALREGVQFVVIGGLAVGAHGHLRTTDDVDLVAMKEAAGRPQDVADLHALREIRGEG